MAIYFQTTTITVDTITLTVTHSLSQTPSTIRVIGLIDRNATGHVWVAGIQTNVILLRATVDASLCDVGVQVVHSIQGGPTGG